MFFVSGITGHVGGEAARLLLAQGHEVRTLSRDPQKAAAWSQQGVDVRQGDFNDSAALAAALEGTQGAFLMVPPCIAPAPGYPESTSIIAAIREALDRAAPERLVILSSVGSEQTSRLGLITATHLLEQAVVGLSVPTAFVRAGSFLENYVGGMSAAAATGVFYTFFTPTDLPVPMVATVDIGAEVASLLVGAAWSGKKIIELGSPTSADDLAHAMGEVLGRSVQAQAVPRDRWSTTCESFGMPAGRTWAYEEMSDGLNSGWIHFGVPGTDPVPAKITPAQIFRQAHSA